MSGIATVLMAITIVLQTIRMHMTDKEIENVRWLGDVEVEALRQEIDKLRKEVDDGKTD